jgi:hypothetical protein
MIDESELDEARALWHSQSAPSLHVPTEVMRTRMQKIDGLMGRARFAVIFGSSLAFPAFGWLLYTFPNPVQRIGGVIVLIAVALQLRQTLGLVVSTRAATGTVGTTPSVVAYRAVLERQRQFLAGPGAWSRLITFPAGGLVFLIGSAQVDGWDREMVVVAALCIALSLGIFISSRVQARRYRMEIEEIDHLQSEES